MKRRAFLASFGVGGLTFCNPSLAGMPRHHQRHPAHGATTTDVPPVSALSESTRQQISHLVSIAPHKSRQERIILMSQAMKGTPYLAEPLIGSATTQEELVLSWRGVNCMTFVEIILAASQSVTVEQFIHTLIATRYRNHRIAFTERRHFLSDWLHGSPVLCHDLTPNFPYAQNVEKTLNLKLPSGSLTGTASPEQRQTVPSSRNHFSNAETDRYLPGIPLRKRRITYLPTHPFLNDLQAGGVHKKIRSGDIIGMYSPLPGLDVFHIGFAIWRGGVLFFRNASSLAEHRHVVDSDLGAYLSVRRGLLVYRSVP